jgi:Transposase DDE domain group 1
VLGSDVAPWNGTALGFDKALIEPDMKISRIRLSRYHKVSHNPIAIKRLMVDLFLDAHKRAPSEIVLDLDATDDPVHGEQEGRFFNAYYDCYCYLLSRGIPAAVRVLRAAFVGCEAAAGEHRRSGGGGGGGGAHCCPDSASMAECAHSVTRRQWVRAG